jgi:C4-dicarboxylate transporter DctM subunit
MRFREGAWSLALPVLVLGGIYGGFYTPSQAGAVAVVYALFITHWVHRELTWTETLLALVESAELIGTLLPIIVLAFGLNEFLALMDLVRAMNPSPAGFLLLVNVVLIVLGALMDSISATLIFAPILAPVAQELFGINPIHFGIVFVVNMEIGYLAPPVATNLFVASAIFRKPFGQVSRAVMPTLGITCLALVLIMYLPTLSLAAIHLRDGKPLWASFPWEGRPAAAAAETPGGAPAEPGGSTPAEAPTGGGALKGLTGKIMMDLDEEETGAQDAGAGDGGGDAP